MDVLFCHFADGENVFLTETSNELRSCPVASTFGVYDVVIRHRGNRLPLVSTKGEADTFPTHGLNKQLVCEVLAEVNVGESLIRELDDIALADSIHQFRFFIFAFWLEIHQCTLLTQSFCKYAETALGGVEKVYVGSKVEVC